MDTVDERPCGLRRPRRARAAGLTNLAGALGMLWAACLAPGSAFLTLYLQEALHAEKWLIGLILAIALLGPVFEPLGAWLLDHGRRPKNLFLAGFLLNRLLFLSFVFVPFLAVDDASRRSCLVFIVAVIAVTRFAAHVAQPAWWSWIGDLIPERRRSRYFSTRCQTTNAASAAAFLAAMLALHHLGGFHSARLVAFLFAVSGLCGVADIVLYFWVPPSDPTPPRRPETAGGLLAPLAQPGFRRFVLGMGAWSFFAQMVLPFLPLQQRALGLDWQLLAYLQVATLLAATVASRMFASLGNRVSSRCLLVTGAGHLFVLALYPLAPAGGAALLFAIAAVHGACLAAWTIGVHRMLLDSTPSTRRAQFVSTFNFVNGLMTAGGPVAGGLAAQLVSSGWGGKGFGILLAAGCIGGAAALCVLVDPWTKKVTEAPMGGTTLPIVHALRVVAVRRRSATMNQAGPPRAVEWAVD
jgi:MFS family permease